MPEDTSILQKVKQAVSSPFYMVRKTLVWMHPSSVILENATTSTFSEMSYECIEQHLMERKSIESNPACDEVDHHNHKTLRCQTKMNVSIHILFSCDICWILIDNLESIKSSRGKERHAWKKLFYLDRRKRKEEDGKSNTPVRGQAKETCRTDRARFMFSQWSRNGSNLLSEVPLN